MPAERWPAQEVVLSPSLLIPKNLIGLVNVLDLLFITRFALVSIGVILHNQFAKGPLDRFT